MHPSSDEILAGIQKVEDQELCSIRAAFSKNYEIIRLLGTGGMGNVYLGKAKRLHDREVAIKVLHQEFANDETLLARFIREAELLKQVRHPRIVEVIEASIIDGITFYVMELVSGTSLEKKLKEKNFPIQNLPSIALKILDALNAIHTVGIIHRDLKPGNIMVTEEGDIKLTDFGIARPENSQLTHHNEIVGSVCYIPPEIWIGEEPTAQVDLYSLGVVLYELATGTVPFDGSSPGDLMRKHLQVQPEDPSKLNPNLPFYLGKIIMKLLAKKRCDRPGSALDVSEMIKSNLGEREKVKNYTEFKQDTNEFLRAVESSATNLISVAREIKPATLEECSAIEINESTNRERNLLKYLFYLLVPLICVSALLYFTLVK